MQTHLGGTRRQQKQEISAARDNRRSCFCPCGSGREAVSVVPDMIDAMFSMLIHALLRGKCGALIACGNDNFAGVFDGQKICDDLETRF